MDAIVLDLDGTLLTSDKKVSIRNKKSIELLFKSRIPLIIATARPPRAIINLLPEEIHSQAIMVYFNGAMIKSKQLGISLTGSVLKYKF